MICGLCCGQEPETRRVYAQVDLNLVGRGNKKGMQECRGEEGPYGEDQRE